MRDIKYWATQIVWAKWGWEPTKKNKSSIAFTNNNTNYVNSKSIKLLIFIEHATVMDHKYKALLQNIPTRHVITAIAKPADRPQQIAKLRNLDINNFFILGSLQSIRDVLDSARDEYFQRNFAWHAITQYNGDLSCNCKNATIIFLKPIPDQLVKDRLGLMVNCIHSKKTTFSLTRLTNYLSFLCT